MSGVIELFLGTMVALLPIANPVSTAALFLGITKGDTPGHRNRQALMGCIYMFFILVVFLVAGSLIMEFFGISIPGLRIAGGLMVGRVALSMLRPGEEEVTEEGKGEAREKEDVSFTPLAMPSLSGPGAIAVTIGLAAQVNGILDYATIIMGILAVCVVCWMALRGSTRLVNFFGVAGMNAVSRIMGFLLLCVGVQFVLNGLIGIVTDDQVVSQIVRAFGG